jgi:hypothetical protein
MPRSDFLMRTRHSQHNIVTSTASTGAAAVRRWL